MTDKIKEEVYKKLWDLFKDECPYIKKMVGHYGQDPKFFYEYHYGDLEGNQIWTILSEILPISIIYKKEGICCKTIQYDSEGCVNVDYQNDIKWTPLWNHFNSGYWHPNIWSSLLSLLQAIEEHPEREKFQYRWGEK